MAGSEYFEAEQGRQKIVPAALPKIAILASGSGTTAEYVIHATQTGVLRAEVGLVVSNNHDAGIWNRLDRLQRQYGIQIPAMVVNGITNPGGAGAKGEQTLEESEAIADFCTDRGIDTVALLGYMKKVRGKLLRLPIVNTHPGPLPATAGCIGSKAQEKVLELGLTHSAQTLHWVDADYDTGDTIAVHEVPIMPGDTADTLFDAVQATEKSWVPVNLNAVLSR